MLADFIHVAGSDREDKVARLRGFAQVALDLFKGLKEFCALNFLREVCRGDAENILFTGGKYLRKVQHIRPAQLTDQNRGTAP